METQFNIFTPKYMFTEYLKVFVYTGGFVFLLFMGIQRQSFNWQYTLITALCGFTAFQVAKNIIKEVEFGENEMIIRYYVWVEKVINYHDININVNSSIHAKNISILLRQMTNRMELQQKIANVLRNKKIREINLEAEIKKSTQAGRKILIYALIATITIGILASSIVHADLAVWAVILLVLLATIVFILAIFIKA